MLRKSFEFVFFLIAFASSCPVFGQDSLLDAKDRTVVVKDTSRLLVLGGDALEIVCELGGESLLIGRDDTGYYPPSVNELPSVGYLRSLGAEGILSLLPSLVIASEDAGPPAVLLQLESAGVTLLYTHKATAPEQVFRNIEIIALALDRVSEGRALLERLQNQLKTLRQSLKKITDPRSVLLLLSVQRGTMLAAGLETGADGMIELAGGKNVVQEFTGFKPLSTESLVGKSIDVILLPSHGVALSGIKDVQSLPELAMTSAVKNGQVHIMDSLYLLGFGPRFVSAAMEIAGKLYPDIEFPPLSPLSEKSVSNQEQGPISGNNESDR